MLNIEELTELDLAKLYFDPEIVEDYLKRQEELVLREYKQYTPLFERRKTGISLTEEQKIAWLGNDPEHTRFGDTITRVPTFRSLSDQVSLDLIAAYPDVFERSGFRGRVFAGRDWQVDEIIDYLNAEQPDLIIVPNHHGSALLDRLSKAYSEMNIRGDRVPGVLFNVLDNRARVYLPQLHSVGFFHSNGVILSCLFQMQCFVKGFDIKAVDNVFPTLSVEPEMLAAATSYLMQRGYDPREQKLILIGDRASRRDKEWSGYEQLITQFSQACGDSIRIAFVDPKTSFTEERIEALPEQVKRMIVYTAAVNNPVDKHTLNIRDGVFAIGDFFIGSDSGPGHLYSAIQAHKGQLGRMVTVFGGENPYRWKPPGEKYFVALLPGRQFRTHATFDAEEFVESLSRVEPRSFEERAQSDEIECIPAQVVFDCFMEALGDFEQIS